jgi:hypothetical protein
MSAAVRMKGELELGALEETVSEIVRRHEVLRTSFRSDRGRPEQVITSATPLIFPVVDLSELDKSDLEAEAQRLASQESQRLFDLTEAPMLRVSLLQLSNQDHIAILCTHHIASDGWSMGVLIRELAVLYQAFSVGEPSTLAELPIQYVDYAVWQREWLQGEVLEKQLAYWKERLSPKPTLLRLPMDRPRPAAPSYRSATRSFTISTELHEALKALTHQEGVTLFMTLVAAFKVLLYRYTGQSDIVIGADSANRNRADTEGLIGFFINILILRTFLSDNISFRELLGRVREVALGAYEHQDLPLEKLVEELRPERDLSPTPLFQALFVFQNTPQEMLELPGLALSSIAADHHTSKFDLAFFVGERQGSLAGTWRYNTELFDSNTIDRMSSHFQSLLESIVARPDAPLAGLEMVFEADKQQRAAAREKREAANLKRLKSVKRKSLSLPEGDLIKTAAISSGEPSPLVIEPRLSNLDLADWAKSNREFIETKLLEHGAIFFRNFDVDGVARFERFAKSISHELFGDYGDLPRAGVGGRVYGSTPYPRDQAILFHNESAHMRRWPMKIWFFCIKAAEQGGETPIVDCRRVYKLLDPKVRDVFARKGLMYVRNYVDGLDVSWQSFFRTTDKAVVEEACRNAVIDFEWKDDGRLRTSEIRQAVANHPRTGEPIFFNQIQLHHVSCLDPKVRESMSRMFAEQDLPRNVYYGDGSRIDDSVIDEVRDVYQRAANHIPWQEGDVLMLDNMLVGHGRNPFVGERKIVVAMAEMICKEDL